MALIRMYFNRSNDFPQVWSVDQGSHASEINVQAIELRTLPVASKYDPNAEYPEPKAWFEVDGTLRIEGGTAIVEPWRVHGVPGEPATTVQEPVMKHTR